MNLRKDHYQGSLITKVHGVVAGQLVCEKLEAVGALRKSVLTERPKINGEYLSAVDRVSTLRHSAGTQYSNLLVLGVAQQTIDRQKSKRSLVDLMRCCGGECPDFVTTLLSVES